MVDGGDVVDDRVLGESLCSAMKELRRMAAHVPFTKSASAQQWVCDMEKLMEDDTYANVEFRVDGQTVRSAHRFVVSRLLEGDVDVVDCQEVDVAALRLILQWIYTDQQIIVEDASSKPSRNDIKKVAKQLGVYHRSCGCQL